MPGLIVDTKYGKLEGTQEGPVQAWKGVPYAQPPLGSLRFRPPQPLQAWSGTRDVSRFSPTAPQKAALMENLTGRSRADYNEDCLYLNVWSPAADNKRRPVMVWIHGGAFVTGAGSVPWYNGVSFASQGEVVVVTINYRLGIFGFLHLAEFGGEDFVTSGNCGILDQVAALQWVHENIEAFGGDPDNVTIFGESAGSMSVSILLGLPEAQGLFHKAILESGTANNIKGPEGANKVAEQVLGKFGLTKQAITKLQEVPVDQLLDLAFSFPSSTGARPFWPIIDGVSIRQSPLEAIAAGFTRHIPILIGSNKDEMCLFTMLDRSWTSLDETGIKERCARMVGSSWPSLAEYYSNLPGEFTPLERWTQLLTAAVFGIPSLRLAEAQLKQAEAGVWMYRFDWPTPILNGALKACHALEIPFVWNNLGQNGVVAFTGDSTSRQPIANRMHAAWIAFAQHGNPSVAALEWPAYNLSDRPTLIFDVDTRVENDPAAAERETWETSLVAVPTRT